MCCSFHLDRIIHLTCTFSRVPIYHRLYLQGFLDLQDILDTPNGPGSETLENEVYVEYQPSEAYQMLAQSASIIKVICTNRVLNLTCLVRKDLKNSKSPRTRFLLSKKPKIIEIEREHQKIGDVKRYRRTGGGPHGSRSTAISQLRSASHVF